MLVKPSTESVTTTLVRAPAALEFQFAKWLMMTLSIINLRWVDARQFTGYLIGQSSNTTISPSRKNFSSASARKTSPTFSVTLSPTLLPTTVRSTVLKSVAFTSRPTLRSPRCSGKKSRIWFKFWDKGSQLRKAQSFRVRTSEVNPSHSVMTSPAATASTKSPPASTIVS